MKRSIRQKDFYELFIPEPSFDLQLSTIMYPKKPYFKLISKIIRSLALYFKSFLNNIDKGIHKKVEIGNIFRSTKIEL